MKKLFERLCTAAMLSAVLFAACTPSEEDSPAPTFPDPVEGVFDLEAEGGNIKTITFNANYKWTVSIPAESSTEFGILTEEGDVLTSLSGPAGEASVQIVCLLDYQDLNEHSVVVSMTMESETREIASFVLYSSNPVFKFRMAEFKDGDYTQSTDEESAFEHVFVDLPSDGKVPMVWSAAEAGYVAYVQVEANFTTTIPQNSSLTVTENASSGRFTEYKLVCNTVNYDNADGDGYIFTVQSETEIYENNDCALLAPQFKPLLEVRKAVVGEDGNFQYGDVYNWVYEDEPLEQSSKIDLVYRPDFKNAIDMYLLVKSNFPATVSGPKWLAVADPQAQTTSTDYVLENVYQISADPATMTLAQETGNLSFEFGTYSVSYGVAHEDYSELFTIDHYEVPTFNFDIAGEFAAQEMGSQEATVGLVSSGDLDFYVFSKTQYGYQPTNADWVTTEYSWQNGTETVAAPVIQNNTLTIDAAANDGEDPREAIVVAYPKAKASELEDWPLPGYFFLNDNLDGLKDEYAKYLCAYVTQDGQAEPVEPVSLEEMWVALQADGLVASFDVLSDGADKLFSTFPDVPAYLITYEASFAQLPDYPFGDNCEFTVNVKYDSYKVYDASMTEIKTPASHWVTLEESRTPGNKYLGVLTDKSVKSESAYFVFFEGSTAVAAVKIDYTYGDGSSEGGDGIVLEFDTMYGQVDESVCQLTELTGGDKVPADIASCWCLTVNATTDTAPAMVALKGLPEGGSWETKTINGIEINNWGSTVIYLPYPTGTVDDYIRYMDASGKYVLSLVFKVNITE